MSTPATHRHALPAAWRFDGFEALDACHRETLRMLEQLAALLRRLDETGTDSQARAMAAAIARHFSITVRQHHEDEELHVFPALAATADPATRHAIECLRQDHFWLDADWRELSPLIEAVSHGLSCPDIEGLRHGADVFGLLCHDHIVLEESLIYPQACANMPDVARRTMDREMAARRREVRGRPAASH